MGEVHDLQHAENQGQARSDKEQQHAHDQPAGGLGDHAGGCREAGAERVEVHRQMYFCCFFHSVSSSRILPQSAAFTSTMNGSFGVVWPQPMA